MKKTYLLFLLVVGIYFTTQSQIITTIGGNGTKCYNGNNVASTAAELYNPQGVAVDDTGNVYFTDENNLVRKYELSTGIVSTFAGGGSSNPGDGGQATAAVLLRPIGLAIDDSGNIYIADAGHCRIRKVYKTGEIVTIAGNGTGGYNGDGIAATAAELTDPYGVYVDVARNVFIADCFNNRIRKVSQSTGLINTIAGTTGGGYNGDGIAATTAALLNPTGVTTDNSGNVFIADQGNQRIRRVDHSSNLISTIAGNGTAGYNGDGITATTAEIQTPFDVKTDASGNVYISDELNSRIRKITTSSGIITTVTGASLSGYNGDGIAATTAELASPTGFMIDAANNIYLADEMNNRIRKVTHSTGLISTVAGIGMGDGMAATSADIYWPAGVTTDEYGNVYVTDYYMSFVRKIDANTGIISTIAGTGVTGYSSNGTIATSYQEFEPYGITINDSGNIYISADGWNFITEVRPPANLANDVAGKFYYGGYSGDNGPATAAEFNNPENIALDDSGNIYIADEQNARVRKVYAKTGDVVTIAGNGISRFGGDGGKADTSSLYAPRSVVFDAAGNLYICDSYNLRIRKITKSTGIISTVVGNGSPGSSDGVAATTACISDIMDVKIDPLGNIYLVDGSRVREVDHTTNIINTIAGTSTQGYNGDNIPATTAELSTPYSIALDASGNLYIADQQNARVRKVGLSIISLQPAPVSVCPGSSCSFTLGLSVTGATYQWQVNTGSGFVNVINSLVYSGATTATLNITGATTAMNGYLYRCQVNYSGIIYTNVVTLIVNPLPVITVSGHDTINQGSTDTLVATGGTSYIWTSGGTSDTNIVAPTVNTTYTVAVTNASGCADSNTFTVIVNITTGLGKVGSNNTITAYPNPATEIINVTTNMKDLTNAVIKIFDASGKELVNTTGSIHRGNTITMGIASLAAGTYFMEIKTPAETETLQFIKQ